MFEDQALNAVTIDKIDIPADGGGAEVQLTFNGKPLRAFTDDRIQAGPAKVFLDLQAKDWHKTAREHIENLGTTHEVNVSGAVLVLEPQGDQGDLAVLLGCAGLRVRAVLPESGLKPHVGMLLGTRGRLDVLVPPGS